MKGVCFLTQVGGGEFVSVAKGNKTSKCAIWFLPQKSQREVAQKPSEPLSFVLQERER